MKQTGAAPWFSIIFPIYNQHDWLDRAIDSVLAQSESDWELILVDDASSDDSLAIAQRAAQRDSRIQVVALNRNGGPGGARNAGLQVSRGLYTLFIDPDDTIRSDLLERIRAAVQQIEQKKQAGNERTSCCDVLIYGLREEYFSTQGELEYTKTIVPEAAFLHSRKAIAKKVLTLEQETLFGYPWNKAYRTELLKNSGVQFKNIRMIEDFTFNLDLLAHIQTLCTMDCCGYFYAIRNKSSSITHAKIPEYLSLHTRRIEAFIRWYEQNQPELLKDCLSIMAGIYCRYLLSAVSRRLTGAERENRADAARWLKAVFQTPLYRRLKPYMKFSSLKKQAAYQAIASGSVNALLLEAGLAGMVREKLPGLFARAKQVR